MLGRESISAKAFSALRSLVDALSDDTGAIILPEEYAVSLDTPLLIQWLKNQQPWSDLPILLMAQHGASSPMVRDSMQHLGNVTVLERPVRIAALVSAVNSALRARQRQYQLRDHLLAREAAQEQLRAADQKKDEFLATLAHEIRNPLAPIKHALYIMDMDKSLGENTLMLKEIMTRQVDHVVHLVDDLLEVSRITRGKIDLKMGTLDLSSVIEGAIEMVRPILESKSHKFALVRPSERIFVFGDSVRLTQLFANLLNNAAKYTDQGGVISMEIHGSEQRVVIDVFDNGTGIEAEMLPRVFDMFAQAKEISGRSEGGLGIGLTLVRSLVELHAGTVEASSAGVGKGSRFTVSLPRIAADPDTPPGEAPRDIRFEKHRFLVLDDNQDGAETLGMLLRSLGAEVQVIFDSSKSLEAFKEFQPTAAFIDIGMPGLNGHDVARLVRQTPEFAGTHLVALSGWGQDRDKEKSAEAGFDHHLVKPINLAQLRAVL